MIVSFYIGLGALTIVCVMAMMSIFNSNNKTFTKMLVTAGIIMAFVVGGRLLEWWLV